MRIELLEEFCVLARLLNYSKASLALHESQSTLSRHIKSMEVELGFPLIGNANNQLYVTREGNIFLNGIDSMLDEYHSLVKTCQNLRQSLTSELYVQEPPYQDTAGIAFLRHTTRYKEAHPDSFIQYRSLRVSPIEALDEGLVDVALDYRHGSVQDAKAHYTKHGLTPVHIRDVPLIICCLENSPFVGRRYVDLEDIADSSIMAMYDAFSPIQKALDDMFASSNIQPHMVNYAASNAFDFFMTPIPDGGLYLLPEGMQHSTQMMSREGLSFVPLRGDMLHFFALFRQNYTDSRDLVDFHRYLDDAINDLAI